MPGHSGDLSTMSADLAYKIKLGYSFPLRSRLQI